VRSCDFRRNGKGGWFQRFFGKMHGGDRGGGRGAVRVVAVRVSGVCVCVWARGRGGVWAEVMMGTWPGTSLGGSQGGRLRGVGAVRGPFL